MAIETTLNETKRRHAPAFDPAAEIIKRRHLRLVTGLSAVTCWRLLKRRDFPEPIRLSAGRIGWRRSDIEAWLEARQAGK